ncbi:VOC family protein [Patulibacter sp. NPDC049589]|uniref:VOC family protein n=1 Tax=Patulibacter sp. NPDC049589 TaxID=3154731 RepID=UPI003440BCAB
MFDHVTIRVADRDASERFYRTVLEAARLERPTGGPVYRQWRDFSLAQEEPGRPVTRNLHLAFSVDSRDHVDAFWRAGVAAGAPDDGGPGPRDYTPSYYGAFLRDPDGNSVEAVHRDGRRTDGNVDHLWIRVADVRAAQRFYDAVAPHAPIRLATDTDGRVSYVRDGEGGGTFSLVADGARTEHVHLAFEAPDRVTVDAFHAAALAAGYADDGAPGPRPEYGPHYYGGYVLDADGHRVESVYVGPA